MSNFRLLPPDDADEAGRFRILPPEQKEKAGALSNFASGVGIGLRNLYQGMGQRTAELGAKGIAPTGWFNPEVRSALGDAAQKLPDLVAAQREVDRPVTDTTAGKIGSVAGGVIPAVAASFIPGMQGAGGAMAIGALQGLFSPTAKNESTGKNAFTGGLGGLAGWGAGQWINSGVGSVNTKLAAQQSANLAKDATAKDARNAGYVIAPSQTNPSFVNKTVEGLSGKIQTSQHASIRNENVTKSLVAKDLGLSVDDLTPKNLSQIRDDMGLVYEAVGVAVPRLAKDPQLLNDIQKISATNQLVSRSFPGAAVKSVDDIVDTIAKGPGVVDTPALLEYVKQLRRDSKANWKAADDPAKLASARAQDQASKALEDFLERKLNAAGMPDLMGQFKDARTMIAKVHSVERALNPDSGVISARDLAKQHANGVPLSGGLLTAAKTASAFPKATQDLHGQSILQLSPLDFAVGGVASLASGNPGPAVLALSRPAARTALLSGPYQKTMGVPSYKSSASFLATDPANRITTAVGQQFRLPHDDDVVLTNAMIKQLRGEK